ncbi:MAG: TauD/TfdA family dioxygenase [Gammaproteobacteria bacterium]|nr:TauD/TfdA family dioxygenase [Gammaproteobacteria bacterium]MYD75663.1 TauD/TfdA family dioxygenase [Gammaproteobacteria bacterium]MYJ51958.1 TauD/TfdA family dioxygenase [Gammaproteobacteria bacterium]
MNAVLNPPRIFPDERHYQAWKNLKLAGYDPKHSNAPVNIANPFNLRRDETAQVLDRIRRRNFALYRLDPERFNTPQAVKALCRHMGLETSVDSPEAGEDNVSILEDREESSGHPSRYIPYTSRTLNWHTDGYYYPEGRKIRSFVLHCARPAHSGGENSMIDHDMLYLEMRDRDPDLADTLCLSDVLTIPQNRENGRILRDAFQGPVFSTDHDSRLYMRYTRRKRHIAWKNHPQVNEALELLDSLLDNPLPWKSTVRLAAGEGILCNNIVHRRCAYTDVSGGKAGRLFYRIRFLERAGTGGS